MIDGPECCEQVRPVARKTHTCCECHGEIRIGETYERCSGIWDGEPMRFKTCLDCVAMRTELDDGEGFQFEGLWDAIVESGDAVLRRRMELVKEKRRKRLPIHPDHAIVTYA